MTQTEIEKQVDQAQQDAITLDFSKWSFQQRQAGKPHDHESWQTARDYVLSRQRTDNGIARYQHLSKIAEAKAAKHREHEREIDRELEPKKQRLMRQWLADNPTFTESDFESKAWIHLRQNLIEELEDASQAAEIKRQLASGRY
jgi:hypothetical protein